LALLTRGAETPTDLEIAENPRAASAKLRAAQVLSAGVAA
jgi:16S rRNA (cytosine1402-N4)-methyltransferase